MTKKQVLNGKFMEEKLKHGYTTEYFSRYFGITNDEFLSMLKSTFSAKAYKGMLSRLKKNEKIKVKSPKVETEIVEIPKGEELSSISILEELKTQEKELRESINVLELKHKSLCSERTTLRNRIGEYKKRLLELQDKVYRYQKDLSSLVKELDNKRTSMYELQSSISEKKDSLAVLNTKIKSIQKISIFFYKSGNLEIDSDFVIDYPKDSKLFDNLINHDLAGQLTINQIRGISKLISLITFLDKSNLKYELVFDNSDLENFFKIVKEK